MADSLLALEAVSKSYWRGPHELRVLVELSLETRAGELTVVWGKRGAGKTTLLKIAAGLEACDRGSVRFAGADLSSMSQGEHAQLMRERIAWVRRSGPHSEMQMLDYVALPMLPALGHRGAYARARDAMHRMEIGGCARCYWSSLSDGERARVGVARGIARRPSLLLVDDPTANLDVCEREDLLMLLRSLADSGVGVLMTAPEMSEMLVAHQFGALSGGRIIAPPAPNPSPAAVDNVIDFPDRKRSA